MQMTGADIIIEVLLEHGVDTVFGYPGGAVLNIYDSIYKYSDRINHIITAHEQAASHAADSYSRTTGKTGVVFATSGPGATNLVTGIATAYMDSIPMIAITGNVATHLLGLDSFQEVDIVGITKPVTKANFIVKDVRDLADTLRKAFYIANEGRKGPVLIDVPKDVSANETEFTSKKPQKYTFKKQEGLDGEIEKALELIMKAERPFIYAGGGVISSEAVEELKTFVELIDAPVSLSLMGQCAFDNNFPRYTGMLGMHGTKTSSLALGGCDLMVVVGSRFSDRVTCNTNTFAKTTKIIHIDIDADEIGKNVEVSLGISGDVKYILGAINSRLEKLNHSGWMSEIEKWKNEFPLRQVAKNPEEVLPQDVIETLDRLTESRAIITTEVGQHQMWAAQYYNFSGERSFSSSGGLGTMGFGLGASIGAKMGNPDKKVINIAGDGSFYMNMNELSTLKKFNIPVMELLFENNTLGMVRQWQRLFYGKRFSQSDIDRPTNFEMLAESFGIDYFKIAEKSDIEPVLKKALGLNSPVLVECIIDKDINVLPMVPAGASVSEPILEIDIND